MKKILMTLAAVLCCATMAAVFTACSDSDISDSHSYTGAGDVTGMWYTDVTGKTTALWNLGKAWNVMIFKGYGIGVSATYYIDEEGELAGREQKEFRYTVGGDGGVFILMTHDGSKYQFQITDGQLKNIEKGTSITLQKAEGNLLANFKAWDESEDPEVIYVSNPVKYTMFVYGNAGGTMDRAIEEGFWEKAKSLLKNQNDVRVVCFYKYGKDLPDEGLPFSGKYADPGDIVWFDLTPRTDLSKIKEEGMQAAGLAKEAIELKLCDPLTLKKVIEYSSLLYPAEEYILSIWGHGSGFNPMTDVPGKYELVKADSRGVVYDEWNNDEELDMYELRAAIKAAGIDRLNTLFFHNCMMGNLETVTTVQDCAKYICCSAHVLSSGGEVLTEFVRGLVEKGNAEDAVAQMFESITPAWQDSYKNGSMPRNGDFKMFRTDKFNGILDASKHLAERLVALYPTQKEAINRATSKVYRFDSFQASYYNPFFDIADYAHLLAKETGDEQFQAIATEMDNAFNEAIVHYRDVNWSQDHLDHYTLSVCLVNDNVYNFTNYKQDIDPSYLCNFNEGYEQCDFHQYTGWGNWLNINEQKLDKNPECGGGGAATASSSASPL